MYPMNLAVVVLVGGHQHLIVGIHIILRFSARRWECIQDPMDLHVVVAVDARMDKSHTIVNIV